jgi:hypothetical protein
MSVAHSPALIRIEAQDADCAASIAQSLVAVFDGGEVSLDGDRFEVEVRPRGDSDLAVVRALDVLEGWVAAEGLDSLLVHVFDLCYRIPVPPQAGTGPRDKPCSAGKRSKRTRTGSCRR